MIKFFNELENKIIIPDQHWYKSTKRDKWMPSVTLFLEAYPKGAGYYIWLKQVGLNAAQILKEAGEIGSEIHNLIDQYAKLPANYELSYLNENGNEKYKWEVWELFCKAMEFFKIFKPEILVHEFSFASDELGYGGTIDIICRINEKLWLIDYKSGNDIYDSYFLQIAAYVKAWENLNPNYKIEKAGILHLKAATRGGDKTGKVIQGKGWQLQESENSINDDFEYFQYCQKLWWRNNKNAIPKILEYPLSFKKESSLNIEIIKEQLILINDIAELKKYWNPIFENNQEITNLFNARAKQLI